MTMATNASEWLGRYANPGAPDRFRWAPVSEKLQVGDVLDDGSILALNGVIMSQGFIWLAERQVAAASYYGWRYVDGMPQSRDRTTGETLFAMKR